MRAASLATELRFHRGRVRRRLTLAAVDVLEAVVLRLDRWADRLAAGLLWTEEPVIERRVAPMPVIQPVRVIPHTAGIWIGTTDPTRALDEFLHADMTLPREVEQ
jgi:hypothetical protein